MNAQGSGNPPEPEHDSRARTWLSPRRSRGIERLAYAVVGAILFAVFLGGMVIAFISWLDRAPALVAVSLVVGLLALALGYRMLVAAAIGRRLYWWPGQRDYDQRQTR